MVNYGPRLGCCNGHVDILWGETLLKIQHLKQARFMRISAHSMRQTICTFHTCFIHVLSCAISNSMHDTYMFPVSDLKHAGNWDVFQVVPRHDTCMKV